MKYRFGTTVMVNDEDSFYSGVVGWVIYHTLNDGKEIYTVRFPHEVEIYFEGQQIHQVNI